MALCRLYTPMEHGSSEDWQPSGSAVPLLWVGSGMWLAKLGYTGFLLERVLLDDIRRHPAAMTKLFLYFENAANKYFLNINKCFVFRNEQTISLGVFVYRTLLPKDQASGSNSSILPTAQLASPPSMGLERALEV